MVNIVLCHGAKINPIILYVVEDEKKIYSFMLLQEVSTLSLVQKIIHSCKQK